MKKERQYYINDRIGVHGYAEFDTPHGYLMASLDSTSLNVWRIYKNKGIGKNGLLVFEFIGYSYQKSHDCFKIYQSFIKHKYYTIKE